MAIEATVLIPTHNHGELLRRATWSALNQSLAELEVFIVGDGTDELTRSVAIAMCVEDDRVRFFDNPKGPRHGEVHRHRALQEASGRIICYLADDDLWLSEHVETMSELLREADFCNALPLGILSDGTIRSWVGHLDVDMSRREVVNHRNFIPLSCGAHTTAIYRSLPHGWRTTPDAVHTDVYMWSQILSQPGIAARTSDRITVLHFPSPWRTELSRDERTRELDEWAEAGQTQDLELRLSRALLDYVTRERAAAAEHLYMALLDLDHCQQEAEALKDRLQQLKRALSDSQERRQSLEATVKRQRSSFNDAVEQKNAAATQLVESQESLEKCRSALESAQWSLDWMQRSLTWRIRKTLLDSPFVGSAIRKVGEVRSPEEGS